MGWAGGSELAEDIWNLVGKYIPKKQQKRVAKKIVDLFEHQDCDTMDEAQRLMADAGLENRWDEEE